MPKPIQPSTSTFRDLIEGGFLYVDKTEHIYQLVRDAKGVYFLSRPRRFGKSLLISTLEEVFKGNKELFQGLWIYDSDYDWQSYPVIHIDFSTKPVCNAKELESAIQTHLKRVAEDYGLSFNEGTTIQLDDLILALVKSAAAVDMDTSRVVILIDEYDKPILDNLDDIEEAKRIQRVMKGFYTAVKALDRYIRFVFITGVSKFTRVTIFSELNHLVDLTMRTTFGTALGLTEPELRDNFSEHIGEFAVQEEMTDEELLDKIRFWYNGFCFAPNAENVYNPFSTMQLFHAKQFDDYWFQSGTPTFLIKQIHKEMFDVEDFETEKYTARAFDSFNIERLALVPLLFQTGYLTIKNYDKRSSRYTLGFPNHEVETAFLTSLIDEFGYQDQGYSAKQLWALIDALESHDLDTFFVGVQALFADIDYNLHLDYEKYYQTIFYLTFKFLGLNIQVEPTTNVGRIDAVITLEDHIYLFEFKINKSAQEALDQILTKKYYEKYLAQSKPITLVGANFSTAAKGLDDWKSKSL
ncbi:MAG: AAA family ATPase [Chloroflexota bacterium]